MRFTNNPYEGFMKEKSYFKGVPPSLPPKGSRCDGCPYWRGIGCVFCYREQLKPKTGEKNEPRTDPDRKNGNPQAGIKMVCQL